MTSLTAYQLITKVIVVLGNVEVAERFTTSLHEKTKDLGIYLYILYITIFCICMYYISLYYVFVCIIYHYIVYLYVLYIIILCIYMYYISLYYVFVCIIYHLRMTNGYTRYVVK